MKNIECQITFKLLQEQYARFRDVFNGLLAQLMAQQGERHECRC